MLLAALVPTGLAKRLQSLPLFWSTEVGSLAAIAYVQAGILNTPHWYEAGAADYFADKKVLTIVQVRHPLLESWGLEPWSNKSWLLVRVCCLATVANCWNMVS